jgi:hypothetical protein
MDKKALIKALRDTAQSASNTIASGVSAPVDLIAAGLRKMGVPVPENALGGSRWMEDVGLTIPVQDGIPKTVGETLGMIVPMAATAKAPQIAAGANRAIENAMAPATLNTPGFAGQRGAIVWHGSPHKFDRFDASKIGTGEGAQAYGHGLYLAESPDVAKAYQTALTHSDDYVDGQLLDSGIPKHFLARILSDESGNVEAARQSLAVLARPGGAKSVADSAKQALKLLDAGERPIVKTIKPEGALYKVDLPDEAIAKMLDWDKPLSQQAPEVRAALLKSGDKTIINAINDAPVNRGDYWEYGGNTYATKREALEDATGFNITSGRTNLGNTPQAVSLRLKELGIPGIRYLDQGSRGAGAGTSNFVVFPGNENMLRILERNNQPLGLMGIK